MVNKLNSLTELNSVIHYGADILSIMDFRKSKANSDLERNKKRISELEQKRQKIKSIDKYLKNSGKKYQRKKRKESQEAIKNMQLEIRNLKKQNRKIDIFLYVQQEYPIRFQQQLAEKIDTFRRSLSPEWIKKFAQITADESHVGDQCSICIENFEIGRNMMQVDCDGKHAFCQVCIEGWFADHKTCPLCRHMFN